ncbi:glycoside hydrolase family 3 N-terminal domain-containing protein [Cellulomonas fimi]|uniref:beta-glucosidase n=1 Tax=Cellulomonas fimi TaxID=1708 RepID=A0A7Y0QH04_CELFI|nr:glycoside hydrolase family 3 N-terminal domain-containing protein [Cellulomonas fimi]NMR18662.1 glycoside hydrolase family 3 protein [Cellulomonas fimi]
MRNVQRSRKRALVGLAVAIPLAVAMAGGAVAAPPGFAGGKDKDRPQPGGDIVQVESRVKPIIERGKRQYRDLNANGKVDTYENWRVKTGQRVKDLVRQMTLEEKAGLMLVDTLNAECRDGKRGVAGENAAQFINQEFMHRFIFRNTVTSPDQAVCGQPGGGFSASTSVTPAEAASFMNEVQELAEGTRLGIPALFKSNARNHIDPDAREGINESAGAMTAFPKEAGIAAAALGEQASTAGEATTGDMSVVEDFAEVMGDEWRSIGLRGMYGYMADLSTEPRWYRTHETFTENADLNANIMRTLVQTLQGPEVDPRTGTSLSPESDVALTMKHFPGGGSQELGLDPHYAFGKTQVYPGGGFGDSLKPFEAAIDAGVSAIMPYYGVPVDLEYDGVAYDEVGFAFSDQTINGLLREQLGFRGYVNSDTGIIEDRAWGLEEATVPERVAAAINSGTDALSGFNDVQVIIDLVEQGLVTEERVDRAAERLLTPMFQMGLFDDPYVDEDVATATVGNEANRAVGMDVQRKSLVLLQNEETPEGATLPIPDGSSVYLLGDFNEETVAEYGYDLTNGNTEDPAARPSAAGYDRVVISITAGVNRAVTRTYASDDPATGLNPEYTNPIVLDGVAGLDGQSPYGEADACVSYGAEECTDDRLGFGGSFPWETSMLDFTGMAESQSWQITPSLDTIKQVMAEADDPSKVVLHVYFRQPYVLDEASGLRDAGAIVAGFGVSDTALFDVLSGKVAPQGRMPFALAGTRKAIEEQYSDLPGYDETTDGALFPFGHGLTY